MTDTLPPPASGPYAYNTFVPSLIQGAGYVDPVFGSMVKRVTLDHGKDTIYARNMMWSADGTRYLHRTEGVTGKRDAWDVIEVATGRVTHTGIPFGTVAADGGFAPDDPEVLYALAGLELQRIRLLSGGTWVIEDVIIASAPLLELGGSINWMDATGRYALLRYGAEPSVYLFDVDHVSAGPYTNPIDARNTVALGSYLGITPDGNYIVGYDNHEVDGRKVGVSGAGQGVSWWIDHETRTIAPEPAVFWSLCGDHGAFCSPSDGRTYMITYNCFSKPGLWRVDITNNADGLDEAGQMRLPDNKQLLSFSTWNDFGHVTTVARGPLRDWCFVSTEDSTDHHDGPVAPWHPYRQEIIAVNVITGEIKRLAHHRSRSLTYDSQPRVSCAWGGEWVGYQSNFNQQAVDIFAIPFAAAAPPEPTPPPQETLPVTISIGGRRFTGSVVET
jgi:hypothetical protein